jgi:hypothetical protein
MSFNLNIANLPSGKYKLSAELVNENGTELSEENFVFEKMVGPFDQSGTGKITTELGVAEKQASDTTSAIKL